MAPLLVISVPPPKPKNELVLDAVLFVASKALANTVPPVRLKVALPVWPTIRLAVPAALETPTGLVVLGQGTAGAGKTLIPLAFQDVEVQGKLYEKGGVRYLDITSAKAVEKDDGDDDPDEGDGE